MGWVGKRTRSRCMREEVEEMFGKVALHVAAGYSLYKMFGKREPRMLYLEIDSYE